VIVLRSGEYVGGLSVDDFTIKEDGATKAIASFEEVGGGDASLAIPASLPHDGSKTVASVGPLAGTVLLMDLLNTPPPSQEFAKELLLRFLRHDYHGDRPLMPIVMRRNGMEILSGFTTDREKLIRVVDQVPLDWRPFAQGIEPPRAGTPIHEEIDIASEYAAIIRDLQNEANGASSIDEAIAKHSLAISLVELIQLAHRLSPIPGMKNIVWATAGFPLPEPQTKYAWEIGTLYKLALQQLGAARATVYPIDVKQEVYNPTYSPPSSPTPVPNVIAIGAIGRIQTFIDVSKKTGGAYCVLHKDPKRCFQRATEYGSRYYLLTFHATPSERLQWHKLHVDVRGSGLQVRARSGYYSEGPKKDEAAVQ
jgi:VWFA-related protein